MYGLIKKQGTGDYLLLESEFHEQPSDLDGAKTRASSIKFGYGPSYIVKLVVVGKILENEYYEGDFSSEIREDVLNKIENLKKML